MKKWKNVLNKFSFGLSVMFVLPSLAMAAGEAENVSSSLKNSSYEPNFFSIILSLFCITAYVAAAPANAPTRAAITLF